MILVAFFSIGMFLLFSQKVMVSVDTLSIFATCGCDNFLFKRTFLKWSPVSTAGLNQPPVGVLSLLCKSDKKCTQPCPCGYYNHPEKECVCPPGAVQKYLNKISGPLLDRIDLHVEVVPVNFSELTSESKTEKSLNIRERVIQARAVQQKRFEGEQGMHSNAQMGGKEVQEICIISDAGRNLLKRAMEKPNLSARAYDRILKVSRTIADLAGSEDIKVEHLAEAIHYRSLDRENWASQG